MKRVLTIAFSWISIFAFAQEEAADLKEAFTKGQASGYVRSFFMATQNEGSLQDWTALAIGGKLKYNTARYKGFSVGAAFYNTFNLGISDITTLDPTTGRPSRYESGLFDVNDLSKKEINLLGELYLDYKYKQHMLTVGRFMVKTPFLNPEDGRMIPTLESGVWYNYKSKNKKSSFDAMWITHIAARSTSEFMTVANSIGSYPVGKNPDGSNSNYRGNLSSAGMAVLAYKYQGDRFGLKAYDYFVENIFNTAFVEPSLKFKKSEVEHKVSGQYLLQTKVNDGGNEDPTMAYVHDDVAQVMGAQYKLTTKKKWSFSANWNYVTAQGRFVFPREWGREFLFTFQKRERLEGVGNTHAWMVDAKKSISMKKAGVLDVTVGYGQYYRPEANNFELNKYAFPANDQLNLDVFWFTRSDKKGLVVELLLTYKGSLGDTFENPNFTLNKMNMMNYNLVLNYLF